MSNFTPSGRLLILTLDMIVAFSMTDTSEVTFVLDEGRDTMMGVDITLFTIGTAFGDTFGLFAMISMSYSYPDPIQSDATTGVE